MSRSFDWHNTLTHHGEANWLELVNVTAACMEENLVTPELVGYELLTLRERMSEANISSDLTRLEECLKQCKKLLSYYISLRNQKQKVNRTGSSLHPAFSPKRGAANKGVTSHYVADALLV